MLDRRVIFHIYSLRRHGFRLVRVTNPQLVELSLNVAAHGMDTRQVGIWFEEHTEPL